MGSSKAVEFVSFNTGPIFSILISPAPSLFFPREVSSFPCMANPIAPRAATEATPAILAPLETSMPLAICVIFSVEGKIPSMDGILNAGSAIDGESSDEILSVFWTTGTTVSTGFVGSCCCCCFGGAGGGGDGGGGSSLALASVVALGEVSPSPFTVSVVTASGSGFASLSKDPSDDDSAAGTSSLDCESLVLLGTAATTPSLSFSDRRISSSCFDSVSEEDTDDDSVAGISSFDSSSLALMDAAAVVPSLLDSPLSSTKGESVAALSDESSTFFGEKRALSPIDARGIPMEVSGEEMTSAIGGDGTDGTD